MTEPTRAEVERLVETLRRVEPDTPGVRTRWYRNPDGPDAADTLLALLDRLERAEAVCKELETYMEMLGAEALSQWDATVECLEAWRASQEPRA